MALAKNVPLAQLDQAQISELQNLLLRAGYDPGPVDGALGPKTQAAYTRFLRANGYDPRATSLIVSTIEQMSMNAGNVWEMITTGGERAQAPVTSAPGAATVPAAAQVGTPAVPAATQPPPTASDGSIEEDVRKRYPHLSYLLDNPEVKDVLLRATQGGWDAPTLQGELWKTSWWQTTSNATRLWDQKWFQDRATAQLEVNQRAVAIGNLSSQMGFNLSAGDLDWVAGKVLREGWSDDQLKRWLGTLARQQGVGPGQITEQAAQLKALAKNYMSMMQDSQATEYATRIAEGSLTREAVESTLRTEAKGRFSWLSSQIDAGLSPMDLFGSTRNAVASELEVDPNSIDFTDGKWSQLVNPVTNEDGSLRSMNFYEAQRWARQQSGWRFTDNANKKGAEMELNLLQALGVRK